MSASSRPCWVTAGIALIVIWLTIITLKLFSHDTVAVLSEEAWPEQWRAPQGEFIDYQVKPDVAVAVLVERRADDGDLGVDHDEAAAAILPEKDPLDDRGLVRGIPNAAQQHPNITLFIILHNDQRTCRRQLSQRTGPDCVPRPISRRGVL